MGLVAGQEGITAGQCLTLALDLRLAFLASGFAFNGFRRRERLIEAWEG